MREYLIFISDYRQNSAGIRVMHRLCHILNTNGFSAYVWGKPNPDWQERRLSDEQKRQNAHQDMIVVYPEVTTGNPLGCEHVVRFVLNVPGLLGGSKAYDPSEMVFVYSPDLNNYLPSPAPQLWIPPIERELFFDAGKERQPENGLYWIGKGKFQDPMPPKTFSAITYDWPETRPELARILQEASALWTYDNYTCLIPEARLCGCPVVIVPDSTTLTGDYTEEYDQMEAASTAQFERFIEITQGALVGVS